MASHLFAVFLSQPANLELHSNLQTLDIQTDLLLEGVAACTAVIDIRIDRSLTAVSNTLVAIPVSNVARSDFAEAKVAEWCTVCQITLTTAFATVIGICH